MISKLHRFHGRNSLKQVYQSGKTVRGHQIALKYGLSERRRRWRAAVVVAKKVHKSAVVRNRIRRRVYSILGNQLPSDNQPYDMIFSIFDEDIAKVSTIELEANIKGLLVGAHILPPKPQHVSRPQRDIIEGKE